MPPQPPIRNGRAIPLLLLSIGYLSIIPFGAAYVGFLMPNSGCGRPQFSILHLIPIFGLVLILGYSKALQGKPPWESPKLFWAASFLYNALLCLFGLLSTPMDFFAALTKPMQFFSDAFYPHYDPETALLALTSLSSYFFLIAMPVAALLSAIEAYRAFRKTKPDSTATPEPA